MWYRHNKPNGTRRGKWKIISAVTVLIVLSALLVVKMCLSRSLNDKRAIKPSEQRSDKTQTPSIALPKPQSVTVADVPKRDNVFPANTQDILATLRRYAASDIITPEVLAFANQDLLTTLHNMGEAAFEAMLEELGSSDSPVNLRILLVELLANMATGENAEIASKFMEIAQNDKEPDSLRLQVLQWLGDVGVTQDGLVLLEWLKSNDNERYEFALTRAIGAFQHDDIVPILSKMLTEGQHRLTPIAAIRGLQKQKPEVAIPVLRNAFRSAISNLDGEIDPDKSATLQHLVHAVGAMRDEASVENLRTVMVEDRFDISVRSAAAESLGSINTSESRQLLLIALEEESNESLLVYVAHGLSQCGKSEDGATLRKRAETVEDEYVVTVFKNIAMLLEGRKK